MLKNVGSRKDPEGFRKLTRKGPFTGKTHAQEFLTTLIYIYKQESWPGELGAGLLGGHPGRQTNGTHLQYKFWSLLGSIPARNERESFQHSPNSPTCNSNGTKIMPRGFQDGVRSPTTRKFAPLAPL